MIGLLLFASAVLSGWLFHFALPPRSLEALAFVAFVPLFVAALRCSAINAAGLGLVAGLTCGMAYVGWHHDITRLFWAYLPFLWIAVILAILCALSTRLKAMSPLIRVITLACVAVGIEYATTVLPLPINIAVAVYREWLLMPLASVTGIWGISWIVWLANLVIAEIVVANGLSIRVATSLAVLCAITTVSCIPWQDYVTARQLHDSVWAIAIQDFTGDETTSLAAPPVHSADRDAMTIGAAAQLQPNTTFVVWSEECLGAAFHVDNPRDETVKLVRKIGVPIVVGYNDDEHPKPHNCAAWLDPSGKVLGVHHKEHLYLGESETIKAGKGGEAFATPLGKVGLEVCFDTDYTNVTRDAVRQGAQIIGMPNYDPPTPRGTLHYLHAALIPFRAAENAVPIVRSDSNGLSEIIDRCGYIVRQGPLYGIGRGRTRLGEGHVLYALGGLVRMALCRRRRRLDPSRPTQANALASAT